MTEPTAGTISRERCLRASHVPYGCVLTAASTAAFGTVGIPIAFALVSLWACVYASDAARRICGTAFTLALFYLVFGVFLTPVTTTAINARHYTCKYHLKELAIGLHNYHDAYGAFPPAVTRDAEGRPMHSWRVLILPFIDEAWLYNEYNFDEPWNSPHNAALEDRFPDVYRCPFHRQGRNTTYVAVTGPRTLWPNDRSRRLSDIPDGAFSTLAVIELDTADVPWMEPRDLSVEEAVALLGSTTSESCGHVIPGKLYERSYGRAMLLSDGRVFSQTRGLDRETALALLRVDDGGPTDMGAFFKKHTGVVTRWRVGPCIALGLFVLLAVLPVQILFRRGPRKP